MREATGYAAEFLQLPAAANERARQMVFRQAMTSLARGGDGPSALAAADPKELTAAVQLALQDGLFDDLEWLDVAGGCLAMHEVLSALGPGAAQRDLARRLQTQVLTADAASFTIVAARMAAGSARALLSHPMRARVSLVMELPLSLCIDDGPLALTILSRRELARNWIEQASTSSLPWRRFASRILERAAREASFRAAEGESHALRPFVQEPVQSSMARLMADREPLVWRYAAAARGMLAPHIPAFAGEIESALDPKLTPTEWRRAATSLVARGAHVDPAARQDASRSRRDSEEGKLGEAMLQRLLPLLERDRGMAGALVWGLPRTADVDEAAAKRWLDLALRVEPFAAAEALCDFLAEYGNGPFAEVAVQATLQATARFAVVGERPSLRDALLLEYRREFEARGRVPKALRTRLFDAMDLFVLEGTARAFEASKGVLGHAADVVDSLVSPAPDSVRAELPQNPAEGRLAQLELRTASNLLRDVSVGLVERNSLLDLLRLGSDATEVAGLQDRFETLREEVEAWLVERERTNDVLDPAVSLRRVRALLHLADSDAQEEEEDDEIRKQRRNARWVRIARTLLTRSMHQPPPMLRRVLLAALARACDGLGREGDGDLVTPFLVLTASLSEADAFETLASASTSPDLVLALGGYARFVRMLEAHASPPPAKGDSTLPPALSLIPQQVLQSWTDQLERFAVDYVPDLSQQSETYRALLLRLHGTLHAILKTETLQGLVRDGGQGSGVLEDLEVTVLTLQKLTFPALRRFGVAGTLEETAQASPYVLDSLAVLIERVVARIEPTLRDVALDEVVTQMRRGLPLALGDLLSAVLHRLLMLPRDATARSNRPNALAPLPNWVPARRSVGGFYLLRAIGAGAAGSVFLAARTEERQEPDAERFALKVPEYSETAARTLTEAQFSKLFREEASALLVLPEHENLSRFVTFDAGARPKPILVTEYIEGVTVENMVQARTLDVPRAFHILDDLAAGLGVLHGLGIGHLDVKPSNLIVRGERAVLVDFGLSGRTLRPGCGTAEYGAPEVWLADGNSPASSSVTAVDVYATACVAFELLTGTVLFEAPSELALVGKHLAHDGVPEGVMKLAKHPKTQELAELFCSALRHDPAKRIGIVELRDALRRLSRRLEREPWPLPC